MIPQRRKALTTRGWKVGTVQELLGLTNEEAALIESRITLKNECAVRPDAGPKETHFGKNEDDLA